MKIRKVKWTNHPILGNLELDFVNPVTNHPFSTIVFAGENGSGKTTILETLNTFLCIGSFKPFDMIEYEVNNELYILKPPMIPESYDTFFTGFDVKNDTAENIRSDKVNNPSTIQSSFDLLELLVVTRLHHRMPTLHAFRSGSVGRGGEMQDHSVVAQQASEPRSSIKADRDGTGLF